MTLQHNSIASKTRLLALLLATVGVSVATAVPWNESGASGTFDLTNWATDRYAPGGWAPGTLDPLGGQALRISLLNADRRNLRTSSFNDAFYDTQGRQRPALGAREVSGELFIPTSWSTPGNLRRADLWSRDDNPSEASSRYPIIGFINNDPADPFNPLAANFQPRFRYFQSGVGWVELPGVTPVYGQYNSFRVVDSGSSYEIFVNGALVHSASGSRYSAWGPGLRQIILNAFNFGNAGNTATLPDSGYDVFWRNVRAGFPLPSAPVDLNGSYLTPNSAALSDRAWAATGSRAGEGQVYERSGGASSTEASFTPFSDLDKRPSSLITNLANTSFSFEVELADAWTTGDSVRIGAESTAVAADKLFLEFNRVGATNTITLNYGAGTALHVDADNTTRYRALVRETGGDAVVELEKLDGAGAGGRISLSAVDASVVMTSSLFFVETAGAAQSTARANVSGFATSAIPNALHLLTDDPYAKSGENIQYRLGQANMNAAVGGFQAFLSNTGGQSYASGSYTTNPYPVHLFPMSAALQVAAGRATNAPMTAADAHLATFNFTAGASEGGAQLNILASAGGLDTKFSDADGNTIAATLRDANRALVDNTAPVLSALTATQGTVNALSNPVVAGALNLTVNAADALSGLMNRPTITLDFAPIGPGGGDVTLSSGSQAGNVFASSYNVPNTVGNGAGEIRITSMDKAGNLQTLTQAINVNTATLTLNVNLLGFASGGPSVTRGINFRLGGVGGPNAPIEFRRNVVFSAAGNGTITLNGYDGLPNTASVSYRVSGKDMLHTLRTTVDVSNPSGNQYNATLNLRGGNLNQDGVIDVGDYVVYATRFGTFPNANTPFAPGNVPHASTLRHADISGNGQVGTEDFTFISALFGTGFDDADVAGFGRLPAPRMRITVRQAVQEAQSRLPAEMDFDNDGWLIAQEIERWLSGRRR